MNSESFDIDDKPTADEVELLDKQLVEFNSQQVGRYDFKPLNFIVRDEYGAIRAGMKAATGWDWLYVEILWVHESHRRSGLGSRLLKQAEIEAKQRGCIGSCLSTFSFQAPRFYKQHGYSVFGQIGDYPAGDTMYFMSKRIDIEDDETAF